MPHVQVKKRLPERPLGRAAWLQGNVSRSVLFDADMYLWPLQDQFVQRGFAPPKRIDAQSRDNFLSGKERLRSCGLPAVNYQTLPPDFQGEPMDGNGLQPNLSAGQPF